MPSQYHSPRSWNFALAHLEGIDATQGRSEPLVSTQHCHWQMEHQKINSCSPAHTPFKPVKLASLKPKHRQQHRPRLQQFISILQVTFEVTRRLSQSGVFKQPGSENLRPTWKRPHIFCFFLPSFLGFLPRSDESICKLLLRSQIPARRQWAVILCLILNAVALPCAGPVAVQPQAGCICINDGKPQGEAQGHRTKQLSPARPRKAVQGN